MSSTNAVHNWTEVGQLFGVNGLRFSYLRRVSPSTNYDKSHTVQVHDKFFIAWLSPSLASCALLLCLASFKLRTSLGKGKMAHERPLRKWPRKRWAAFDKEVPLEMFPWLVLLIAQGQLGPAFGLLRDRD